MAAERAENEMDHTFSCIRVSTMIARSVFVVLFILIAANVNTAVAADRLEDALKQHSLTEIFPGADHVGKVEGKPPAAPAFQKNRLIGYIYLTSEVINSAGYSGGPVQILAGIDLDARITGAVVHKHEEPILILGIPHSRLDEFIHQLVGIDVRPRIKFGPTPGSDQRGIDVVSGATITSHVFADSVTRAGRLIARDRGLIAAGIRTTDSLDMDAFREATWADLLADHSIRALKLSRGQVADAFSQRLEEQKAKEVFIDLFVALATPAGTGQNLLGFAQYNKLITELPAGAQAIFVAGQGLYSFRGYNYRQSGSFERLQLIQGDKTIRFTKNMHRPIKDLKISGQPDLRERSLFVLGKELGLDPLQPWRIEILVEADIPNQKTGKNETRFASFPLSYILPDFYRIKPAQDAQAEMPADPDMPLWEARWRDMVPEVVTLLIALVLLFVLLVLQDWLVTYRRWMVMFRVGYLAFTLVFIGWVTAAQLSIVNVLTFIGALLDEFRWDFFLLEPLIFILWSFVAVAVLFWGRGVFCGWLCPFGALQDLLNRVAEYLKIPQFTLPFALNERLWTVKYILVFGLLAVSLGPVEMAGQMTEIEPFKTVIVLKFARAWPFVAYGAMLLTAGLFVNRFFCRYLCPLGAALAIPANNAMFNWLKRRPQCGLECQVCELRCPVQAIHPTGKINMHECIYCLDCQNIFHDDQICPPLVAQRKRRERRKGLNYIDGN